MTDSTFTVKRKPLVETEVLPAATRMLDDGARFFDFGRAAFGTLLVPNFPATRNGPMVVHLGEKLTDDGRIDRRPPGSVRYVRIEQEADSSLPVNRLAVPPDERNTGASAIKMPEEVGEVVPFRYAEIENAEGMDPGAVRQVSVHYPFDDDASAFESSDGVLNAVWALCKYSIKATTFCGVYVDGDRERIPYEGDAYINQLCHYCVDHEYDLARYTHEYLIQHPTWPTEWQLHSVLMSWMDYLYTGKKTSLEKFYDDLCVKSLIDLARDDGLISVESDRCTEEFERRLHLHRPESIFGGLRDLVDWPPGSFTRGGQGERDGHQMLPINTVVNAFHGHALDLMSRIARVLGRMEDHQRFADRAGLVRDTINDRLFDPDRGVYVDGEGAEHASLHSNMFMLAFDLVPEDRRPAVVDFVKSRGMACSVYGAQHLLEAMYKNGESDYALDLLTAQNDRSWWNMIQEGSTITMEAWDWKYKNNLDWNHAWGAAPANIIPRYLMGVRPLGPGFGRILIQPRPGGLEQATLKHPTPRGPVSVELQNSPGEAFHIEVDIPADATAQVHLPAPGPGDLEVFVDGRKREESTEGGFCAAAHVASGQHTLEARCR